MNNLTPPLQTDHTRASDAKSVTPLCFVIDEDARIRHFLSLILQGAGVDAVEFGDGSKFRSQRLPQPGEMIFLNVITTQMTRFKPSKRSARRILPARCN